jgi:hypothetical protein
VTGPDANDDVRPVTRRLASAYASNARALADLPVARSAAVTGPPMFIIARGFPGGAGLLTSLCDAGSPANQDRRVNGVALAPRVGYVVCHERGQYAALKPARRTGRG